MSANVGQQTLVIRSYGWQRWMSGVWLQDACPQSSTRSTVSNAFTTGAPQLQQAANLNGSQERVQHSLVGRLQASNHNLHQ